MKFAWSLQKSFSKHAEVDVYYRCKKENCGLVSMKGKFLVTFILSILSASFGVTKFMKNGPMTLVPRTRYGPSFLIAMLCIGGNLVFRGISLSVTLSRSLDVNLYKTAIGYWFCTNLLPHLVYVSLTMGNKMVSPFAIFLLQNDMSFQLT